MCFFKKKKKAKEEAKKAELEKKKAEEAKKAEVKKADVKKADAKKVEKVEKAPAKKAPVKEAPTKEVSKEAAPIKKAPAKKGDGKVYHVSKNADGVWEVKLAQTGGAAGKVIRTFKTKPEAEEYVNQLAENTGRTALVHASKGKHKGRIQ